MAAKYRIGIDVGGTNTDAVILQSTKSTNAADCIVTSHKALTTPDVTSGIRTALETVLNQSGINKNDIAYLSIGTTHFLNAVIEADARRLSRVAVLRLAGPYTARCPPFIDFPSRLRAIIEGHVAIVDGGLEVDGKEITPVNKSQLEEQCSIILSKGIKSIVIVGVFSPLASPGTQEEYAKKVILDTIGPDTRMDIICSKDVGQLGLLERENASILNASILAFARRTIAAYRAVIRQLDLKCPLFLTQLDGTLVPASIAAILPIRTFSNGPTNSMRGAAFLAGLDGPERRERDSNAQGPSTSWIVVDIGGTTTDVGVLLPSGFPRKAAAFTLVGGVRTNFSMPDIHCIGLGGGSRVRFSPTGSASVGPDSVGHDIVSRALVFGGGTLTATDLSIAAVASKSPEAAQKIGDATLLKGILTPSQIAAGRARICRLLSSAIDGMKTSPGPARVLLVGGGAVIVSDANELDGVAEVVRPPFFDVANAVGAAIARVSGIVDRVETPGAAPGALEEILVRCKEEAVRRAIEGGAKAESVEVVEVSVVQLPYVVTRTSRITIRAVGDLDIDSIANLSKTAENKDNVSDETTRDDREIKTVGETTTKDSFNEPEAVDPIIYKPNISVDGIWFLSETDIAFLADGCAVLGCGGGGATYAASLMARQAIRDGRKIRVVDVDYLLNKMTNSESEKSKSWVLPCGFMGSPSVAIERIPSGNEIPTAVTSTMRFLGVQKSDVAGVISDEIGGKNGLEPMLLAAKDDFDFPVVDGDLMGRAYPRLEQILPCVFKENALCPISAADGVGNSMIVPCARNSPVVEDMLRAACTVLGSAVALSPCPMKVDELKSMIIVGSTSQAWRVGRAIAICRKTNNLGAIPDEIAKLQDGKRLFVGKIVDVKREVRGGFTHGYITIAPLLEDEVEIPESSVASFKGTKLEIPFQNENICAKLIDCQGTEKILCSVPDLIAVLDSQSGASIGTQDYRYGLRVTVIGLSCDPRWATEKGLEIGGPKVFGLTNEYRPIGRYTEPRSIIKEFGQPSQMI